MTYKERESFLELGDLLLSKRIGLQCQMLAGILTTARLAVLI
jgi:hypothetical protein